MSSVECLNFNYEDTILSATAVCTHFHALLRPKSMNENYRQPIQHGPHIVSKIIYQL